MKYPFSYGDDFTGDFAGVAYFQENTVINFSGTYTVTADAYGTLILPDRIIKNALRVKSEKNAIEVNPCSYTYSKTTSAMHGIYRLTDILYLY